MAKPMTFTIIGKPDATTIQVCPKPIAVDDPALTTLEQAYANIDTRILNAATVNRLNTDASAKTNLFFDKMDIETMNFITDTMLNGQEMYMVYDGDIETFTA